jgi:hypothetical protein
MRQNDRNHRAGSPAPVATGPGAPGAPTRPPRIESEFTMKTRLPGIAIAVAIAAALGLASGAALAQTTVKDAWVRGTVAQQSATGAFASITSQAGGKLVAASSPVAGVVEIHEMRMDGSVMKMRAVPSLDLPAGKAVDLIPGAYHIMLMDLKQTLKAGDSVPLTLVIEGTSGKRETVEVRAAVKALADHGSMTGHMH